MGKRQRPADHPVQALAKDLGEPLAFQRIIELGRVGIHVHGQAAFAPHVIPGVFEARHQVILAGAQFGAQGAHETFGIDWGRAARAALVSD